MTLAVRAAVPADREAVLATVVAAFARYEAWHYLLAGQSSRLASPFAGTLFDLRVGEGNVWVADGGAAVAMWEAPAGTPRTSGVDPAALWEAYRQEAGERAWECLAAYDRAVESVAPPEPYWYLGVLATRPGRWGEGLARAVLEPMLRRADDEGLPCCLETSDPANLPKYERLGFAVASDVVVPGGPATWWLMRTPR